ncbi:MAG: ribosome maturation factor RimP [Gemmatimonadota bacterium]|nr:MAG: ribosome maturation factor RimP [Gemmatimonadota bacterium]
MSDAINNRVKELVERAVQEEGFELVDIQFPRFRARQQVRIFIDKEGGVTVGDCRQVSKRIGEVLDIENPYPMRYTLEVSSPGVDRPLKTVRDFQRNVGRTLSVSVSEEHCQEVLRNGVLKEVDEETVVLETDGGRLEIPLRCIVKAQVCTKF